MKKSSVTTIIAAALVFSIGSFAAAQVSKEESKNSDAVYLSVGEAF